MKPTIGRVVLYRLANDDLDDIINLAKDHGDQFDSPEIGDLVPAIIVKVYSDQKANLKVFLDGDADLWVMNVCEGPEEGQWQWPTIESQASDRKPYTMRYHQLFNLGNFQNESIDIERTFPPEVDSVEALKLLKVEVLGIRKRVAVEEKLADAYGDLQAQSHALDVTLKMVNNEKARLEKELRIKPEEDTVSLTEKGAAASAG